jgi:hypothetical protein
MRMKDGIFEEHWDVIQDEATREQSKGRLPMFGDEFPKERLGAGRNLSANRACTSKLGRRRLMKLKAGELSFNVLESGSGEPALLFLHYWGGSARTLERRHFATFDQFPVHR